MTQFENLGVFISVIVGLVVAHNITSTGKIILNRKEIQLYWPHSLWCLNILLYLVNFWWFIFYAIPLSLLILVNTTWNRKFHAFFSDFWFIWVMGYILLALKW
jgi:hypothetical protein